MIDTQDDTRFELEDTKHLAYQKQKKETKDTSSSEHIKKSGKYIKNTVDIQDNVKIEKNLFNYLYIIGKGGFGKVWKCEHKKTKNQYAMK